MLKLVTNFHENYEIFIWAQSNTTTDFDWRNIMIVIFMNLWCAAENKRRWKIHSKGEAENLLKDR